MVNDSDDQKEDEDIDFNDPYFKIPDKYDITLLKRCKKIGPYYIV